MTFYKLEIGFTIDTALSVGASAGALQVGIDKITARDSEGKLIIPASALKGKLRHECERLFKKYDEESDKTNEIRICRPPRPETVCPRVWMQPYSAGINPFASKLCPICEIFGGVGYSAKFFFGDAIIQTSASPELAAIEPMQPRYGKVKPFRIMDRSIRPGVSLSRRRRTAEEDRLFMFEVSSPNAKFQFKVEAKGFLPLDAHLGLIIAGFKSLCAFGGGKSRGLGWMTPGDITIRKDGNTVPAQEFLELIPQLKERKTWQIANN